MAVLPALADLYGLEDRFGRELAAGERARALAALDDASALVRQEGAQDWVDDGGVPNPPGAVAAVVLAAALRTFRNPEGLSSETIDDYTYRRAGVEPGVYLTDTEKAIVRRYRPTSGLWTLRTTRGDQVHGTVYGTVPGGEPLPLDTYLP